MTVCYRCICYQSLQCLVSATVAWICTYNISITNIHNSPIILCLSFCRWYAVFPGRHLLTYKLSYSIRSCSATFHQFHVLHVIHFNKIWTFAPCDFLFLNCELLLTDGQTAKHNAASVDCMTRCMCVCVSYVAMCASLWVNTEIVLCYQQRLCWLNAVPYCRLRRSTLWAEIHRVSDTMSVFTVPQWRTVSTVQRQQQQQQQHHVRLSHWIRRRRLLY